MSAKEALERARQYIQPAHPGDIQADADLRAVDEALATLQPSGERREAIASLLYTAAAKQIPEDEFDGPATWDEINKKISDPWFQEHYPETITELIATLKYYRVLADAILASGLVQDEAGWRDSGAIPMDGANVLIAEDHRGSSGEAYYDAEEGRWYWANTGRGDYPTPHEPFPTHWQPLPAPPIRSARDGGAET